MSASSGGNGGQGNGGGAKPNQWFTGGGLQFDPPKAVPKRTEQEVRVAASQFATQYADNRRAERARELHAELTPYINGTKEVTDRDKSGNMNLIGDNVTALKRRYSVGTLNAFSALLPLNTHELTGHENDRVGIPGFKGNKNGPYRNYIVPPQGTRTLDINAHVGIGESEYGDNKHNGYADYMIKHEKEWKP